MGKTKEISVFADESCVLWKRASFQAQCPRAVIRQELLIATQTFPSFYQTSFDQLARRVVTEGLCDCLDFGIRVPFEFVRHGAEEK